jgi:DNA-directed RNA polymerase subunit RPC12/RpoP
MAMNTHTMEVQWPYYKCIRCKREAPADNASFDNTGSLRGCSPPPLPWEVVTVVNKMEWYRMAMCPDCSANFAAKPGE